MLTDFALEASPEKTQNIALLLLGNLQVEPTLQAFEMDEAYTA
jgi:hypothetical protein